MGEEDEYACVNKTQLKIKDNSGIKKKKKKKSNKETEKLIENDVKQQIKHNTDTRTKAEIAFQKMQEKMVKGPALSKKETEGLLDLIEKSITILTPKTSNAAANKLKNEEWIRITNKFNDTVTKFPRTPQQLKLKWENLKKNARRRTNNIRMNELKADGGPPDYIPPDYISERVDRLISSSTPTGNSVSFGGDEEESPEFVGCGEAVYSDSEGESSTSSINGSNGDVVAETTSDSMSESIPNTSTPGQKRLTFDTPRTVEKKKADNSTTARNIAIAKYFEAKKELIGDKIRNIRLLNEKLKLENEKLKLEIKELKSTSTTKS